MIEFGSLCDIDLQIKMPGVSHKMKQHRQDNDLDRQIEVNLRRVFQEKSSEPVPDKFLKLLQELKEQDDRGGQHDRS